MARYELFTLDVWGNASEGYDVNDVHRTGTIIEFPDDATDDQIRDIMVAGGHFKAGIRKASIGIDDLSCDGFEIMITDERRPRLSKSNPESVAYGHGKPEYKLRRIDDTDETPEPDPEIEPVDDTDGPPVDDDPATALGEPRITIDDLPVDLSGLPLRRTRGVRRALRQARKVGIKVVLETGQAPDRATIIMDAPWFPIVGDTSTIPAVAARLRRWTKIIRDARA